MGLLAATQEKTTWLRHAGKTIAVAASTGAALVSVITALYSYGVVGRSESHQAIGNFGAAWVGLQPTIETASAIGETTHFAATIADKSGSILVGAHPAWTTGDTNVAVVLQDGSVIARGPGTTLVSVVVGNHIAHSRIHVKQKVAVIEVANAATDSGIVVSEGSQVPLKARALDARGHEIVGAQLEWQVDDSSVAALDGRATLVGRNAGRTMVGAKLDDVTGHTGVTVVTVASGLALVAGTDQRAIAGSMLPQPIVVRATNRKGAPAAGQLVSFNLPAGQGAVQPATAITDADGRARATWTLGDNPGRQRLLASVARVDSAIAIVAEADPVVANTRVVAISDHPSGRAGDKLAEPVAVRVTDSTGRALVDVPVRWTALDGGAVDAVAPRTDSMGVARARWTLAKKTGTQRARAEVGGPGARGIAPVTIGATALAGAAVGITVVRGDNQRAAAGAELPKALVIKVVDVNGSGVAEAEVILSPSGGVIPDSAVRTDSLGVVRTRWTLGHAAREYSLAVHVNGVKKLFKLTAHASPATAANLSFDDAPATSSKGASAKAKHLYVLVTDVYGNPVPDAKVGFSATSGVVTPARAVSDSKGRAALAWTLGAKPGEQTLSGAVRGSDVRGAYVTQVAERPAKAASKATSRPAPAKHPR
jgi:hypothetical protein